MKTFRTTAFAALALVAGLAADAQASVLTFKDDFSGSARAGGVGLSYNTQTQKLDVTIDAFMSNQNAIGLTLGSGKAGADNAILWVDTVSKRVTAFENKSLPKAWKIDRTFKSSVGDFITGYSAKDSNFSYNAANQQTMFSINVSVINGWAGGPAWEGLDFSESVSGKAALFWYATSGLKPFRYNADGSIRNAVKDDGAKFGSFSGATTNIGGNGGGDGDGGGRVPGPAPVSLIAAMALFGAWRRKRSAAG